MSVTNPVHVVAIFGGACSGSAAAEVLANAGARVVVFDQNPRPYGKIEDGLPRWHDKQRRMEYERINSRLDRPEITFVPRTALGRDLDFLKVARDWGFSAIILANGAWRDRPLEIPGAEAQLERGLLYQNPFIYWFNHKEEAAYDGPRYRFADRTVVIGGGLASIDVIKIVQLELYARALQARGIAVDVIEMEHAGIPRTLAGLGINDPASLGVAPGILVYRRRIADMPLAPGADSNDEKAIAKAATVREKILAKSQEKFLFEVQAQTLPLALVEQGGKLVGLRVVSTRVEGRQALPVPASERVIPTELVISSIGSIPEPVAGVEMSGVYYRFRDEETGVYEPVPGVFGVGNVITGQGNIKVSLDHGRLISRAIVEKYLGLSAEGAFAVAAERGASVAAAAQGHLNARPPLSIESATKLLDRARARQAAVGMNTSYREWIASVTPADLV